MVLRCIPDRLAAPAQQAARRAANVHAGSGGRQPPVCRQHRHPIARSGLPRGLDLRARAPTTALTLHHCVCAQHVQATCNQFSIEATA
jgi:hypothetical protein